MNQPKILNLNYSYKKHETEVWVLNIDDIPIDKHKIKNQQIVHLAPQSIGGNHKHSRTEWFIGIGDLVIIWLDETGKKHEELMHSNGQIRLIEVPPFTPHAIVNQAKDKIGVVLEFSDSKKNNPKQIKII